MSDRLAVCGLLWGVLSAAMLCAGGIALDWSLIFGGGCVGLVSILFVLLAVWVND